ncbi:hypothetical protein [Rhizobium ruizarguesonis]|uniref:hypothetical protein n=1 Tax=Rhizobium ruizarguesonis TaxID=2081791 RepID=UPI001030687B|nr:hypothetical protein [Rhizobium ruizarguesonis]TBE20547.1 hypothetical protein ELH05_28265 [Rhizobium ruizarguesonis]TCA27799.1 hypothetical protein E0H66_31875 [Rhizobium leguminosarum bv. viciae]WSH23699.1 hypothetical protein U8Q07_25650 [Rhizobium ruizarguesonis]WSH37095.1 hypothetical protein U8P70_28495 [Rhizobium ruizarguesonis]
MSRGSFRQADIETLLRAAKKEGAVVQVDLRALVATILPLEEDDRRELRSPYRELFLAPDGKENWED